MTTVISQSSIVLASVSLLALKHPSPPVTHRVYKAIAIAALSLEGERMRLFMHHLRHAVFPRLKEEEQLLSEVMMRFGRVEFEVSDGAVPAPTSFETLQFRQGTPDITALERWYQPKDRVDFNPVIQSTSHAGPMDASLIYALIDRCQVPT
jgi:hypothetical protein